MAEAEGTSCLFLFLPVCWGAKSSSSCFTAMWNLERGIERERKREKGMRKGRMDTITKFETCQ